MKPPVLVQLDLVGAPEQAVRPSLLPLFAELNQAEWPLVFLTVRPDAWKPTRNRVDQALIRQTAIQSEIHRSGGALDAIAYLDFGLFTRKTGRRRVIADLADRYGCRIEQMHAIVCPGRIAESLAAIMPSVEILEGGDQVEASVGRFLRQE